MEQSLGVKPERVQKAKDFEIFDPNFDYAIFLRMAPNLRDRESALHHKKNVQEASGTLILILVVSPEMLWRDQRLPTTPRVHTKPVVGEQPGSG